MKKLVLFGPPGAGKGTFASQVKEVLPDIVHVSTGDIFRENLKNETKLGKKVKEYLEEGELVPDKIVNEVLKDRLEKEDIKKNGFILDGYPRNLAQAEALEDIVRVDLFLLLEVPRKIIKERILGRFSCPECGEIYNKYSLQPEEQIGENKWKCDECGAKIEFKQRSDDTKETLENRLSIYDENAKPIIEFYKEKGKLKRVDATNTLDYSKQEIKEIIEV